MSFKCVGCGDYKAGVGLDGPQYCKECESKRTTCDTPGCGREIPKGGEGLPEICPTCLVQIGATSVTLAQLLEDEARGFAKGTAMVRAYVQSLCDQLEVLRVENERLRPTREDRAAMEDHVEENVRRLRILGGHEVVFVRRPTTIELNAQGPGQQLTARDARKLAQALLAEADELDTKYGTCPKCGSDLAAAPGNHQGAASA